DVAERAMRLDVRDAVADQRRHPRRRAHLVGDQARDLLRRERDAAPPEAPEVGEAGMGAHGDAAFLRRGHRRGHDLRVAGVEAAGDVGAGDETQHRAVVAHAPGAEAFRHVAVEVDGWHAAGPLLPIDARAKAYTSMAR